MFVDQKMEPEDFKEVKTECNTKITQLENRLEDCIPESVSMQSRIGTALNALYKLDVLYENGTPEERRQIISSIYPEKLSFDGKAFRTARLNSVAELVYTQDKRFSEIKKPDNIKKIELSGWEVPPRFELVSNYL
jgi:site-specific DNA recombinase